MTSRERRICSAAQASRWSSARRDHAAVSTRRRSRSMRPRNYVVSDTLPVRARPAGLLRIWDMGDGGNASETIRWPELLLVLPAPWASVRLFYSRQRSSYSRHCRQRARACPPRNIASASIVPTKAIACRWRNPRTDRKNWRRRRLRPRARCRRAKFRLAAIRPSARSPRRSSVTSTGAASCEGPLGTSAPGSAFPPAGDAPFANKKALGSSNNKLAFPARLRPS